MSKTALLSDRASILKDFLALSRILTGVENLDTVLGRQYLDRGACSKRFEPDRTLAIQPELDGHDGRQINSAMKSEIALEILRGRKC